MADLLKCLTKLRSVKHTVLTAGDFTPPHVDRDSMNTDGLHDDTHRLSLLFSFSFDTSSLPDIWKIAVVCPVFKKGMSSDVSNYRPISLTSIVCKTMEAIVKDQFISYMLANDNHQATTRFSQ